MARRTVVLVVHKEKMLVDLLVRSLEGDRLSMCGTGSIVEAGWIFEQRKPDLVIIDPAITEAFPLIERATGGLQRAQVVALVDAADSSTSAGMQERALRAGASRIVEKAAGLDGLADAIRQVLDDGAAVADETGRVRILVVDDDEGMRSVLADYLGYRGYAVGTAANGIAALETIEKDPRWELVLLDVGMPGMGGLEVLRRIMERPFHPDVVMTTAVADRQIARGALEAGAFDYVLKPFDLSSIDASIVACLSYNDYHRQPWWKRLVRRGA